MANANMGVSVLEIATGKIQWDENYRKLYDKVFNDRVIDFVKTNITIKSKEVSSEEYREKI